MQIDRVVKMYCAGNVAREIEFATQGCIVHAKGRTASIDDRNVRIAEVLSKPVDLDEVLPLGHVTSILNEAISGTMKALRRQVA